MAPRAGRISSVCGRETEAVTGGKAGGKTGDRTGAECRFGLCAAAAREVMKDMGRNEGRRRGGGGVALAEGVVDDAVGSGCRWLGAKGLFIVRFNFTCFESGN